MSEASEVVDGARAHRVSGVDESTETLKGTLRAGPVSPHDLAARAESRSTGDDAVDQALLTLEGIADQPLRAHVAAFDALHVALQDRLADAEA